ncbi:MAG TPA: putative toxin-antitoxin system toxin component, PIN family [Euryarchaeota archaeon]|nr:putative toxin-antitoxin system toxin component, PIN family [Euryarchaeota archaeon]
MGKVKKVVIDTNIFISGFGWNGKPKTLLTLLKNNQIVNYFSPEIFEELKRVQLTQSFAFPSHYKTKSSNLYSLIPGLSNLRNILQL